MFKLISKHNYARRGVYSTAHGAIETPVFMNVATQGAIKGAVSSVDLKNIGCRVALANTYHLHIRPGDELIRRQGGLHKFMGWGGPILTDSGGFQIFSLAGLRKISEEGVAFNSHVDGRKIFMSPEDSIRIQKNLGSDIMMAFDECIEIPAPYEYVKESCERTYRWLVRCMQDKGTVPLSCAGANPTQGDSVVKERGTVSCAVPHSSLFGINQGAAYKDLRVSHMKRIAELCLPGYAIGGLAVGETAEQMYDIIEVVEEHMPKDKPRYLMGVGTPQNIVEAVARGIDFFDCVLPARNGRHGRLYTWSGEGSINIKNERYKEDSGPIDGQCDCPVCGGIGGGSSDGFSRAYIRHLFKSGEMLAMRLAVLHNLHFYNTLMKRIRDSLDNGTFEELRKYVNTLSTDL